MDQALDVRGVTLEHPKSRARRRRDTAILAVLTLATTALAIILVLRGASTWLEAISFVTGAICVWLTVRESVWNFPIGLANEVAFFVVFARARLFADAGLQVIYFALTGIGWYMWLYGGPGCTTLRVSSARRRRLIRVAVTTIAMWLGLFFLLRRVADSAPLLDALTTSLSLSAQWLLDRKHLQNWLVWMAVDVIYVPLYTSRSLYLSAVLYAVFLIMCLVGWRDWRLNQAAEAL